MKLFQDPFLTLSRRRQADSKASIKMSYLIVCQMRQKERPQSQNSSDSYHTEHPLFSPLQIISTPHASHQHTNITSARSNIITHARAEVFSTTYIISDTTPSHRFFVSPTEHLLTGLLNKVMLDSIFCSLPKVDPFYKAILRVINDVEYEAAVQSGNAETVEGLDKARRRSILDPLPADDAFVVACTVAPSPAWASVHL